MEGFFAWMPDMLREMKVFSSFVKGLDLTAAQWEQAVAKTSRLAAE